MTDQSRYAGMTVNERLFDAGLMDSFEGAAISRDRAEMIRLLTLIDVEDAGRQLTQFSKDRNSTDTENVSSPPQNRHHLQKGLSYIIRLCQPSFGSRFLRIRSSLAAGKMRERRGDFDGATGPHRGAHKAELS
ncbi:MAG TPA: hypothetical protein VGN68_09125 [Sphingopyxis sp.]|jgi:hypothetical protein|uniref:hypothetical protein n=1 Tax=Sphingopyxis sp. TaxID=1908224 RepID=UPI002E139FE4|nr:hypothetical protein [Sphingopyxis sp.]